MRRYLACAALIASVWASALGAAEVLDVRLWRAPDHTRIVFDLSAPVSHKSFTLDGPERIVLDLDASTMKARLEGLALGDTPVSAVRSGVREGTGLRVVLDMRARHSFRSFPVPASGELYDRLVIDIFDDAGTADTGFTESAPQPAPEVRKRAETSERRRVLVAIDAGHGGEDPGAIGPNKLREKDVVLAIARELHGLLERDAGFEPRLLRTGDYFISLRGRRDMAKGMQADMFVSVHADAFTRPQASGASVFALSERGASSDFARFLAQRENASDLVGGVSLSDKENVLAEVLYDLSMTATLDSSLAIGGRVLRELGSVNRLHKRQVETAGFAVLRSPDIPSILVETGFISNPEESRKLATKAHQRATAEAIYRGIRSWFVEHPPPGTYLAWQREQGEQEYVIARGDTLSGIAQRFNVPVATLRQHNALSGSVIRVGQKLVIPAS
jgi:N-acetylmuramoyl-L-alanine amidase